MIRTYKFALRTDSALSQVLGYLASQQNLAYNAAVDLLNRAPHLAKRSGQDCPVALNTLIAAWRRQQPQKADAPAHIHRVGSEQAWDANQRLQASRRARQQRLAAAAGQTPAARDTRPHRRTLAHRRRKDPGFGFALTDKQRFRIGDDGRTLSAFPRHARCRFTLRLRDGQKSLQGLDVRAIQLVPVRVYAARTPLARRHYCLHVQAWEPDPPAPAEVDLQAPADVLGGDRGVKNQLVVSSDPPGRIHHAGGKRRQKQRRQHQRQMAGKPRDSRRRRKAVRQERQRSHRAHQRRDQDLRRQCRDCLEETQPLLVALEHLRPDAMRASARGTRAAPGRRVVAKRQLNAGLSQSALGRVGVLFQAEAAKQGIPTVAVSAGGTSQTCPRCGFRHRDNRMRQAGFRCLSCGLRAHADAAAAVIIRNRAFCAWWERRHGRCPDVEVAPTGWREQPSRACPVPTGPAHSACKPDGRVTLGSVAQGRLPGLPGSPGAPSGKKLFTTL